jgi:hypothetical protein
MTPTTQHPPLKHHFIPVIIGSVIVLAFVSLFTAALHNPEPHGVKVAIVAGKSEVAQLQRSVDLVAPHGFRLIAYSQQDAAAVALKHENVEGVLIPAARPGPKLLIASADGFAVSDLVQAAFASVGGHAVAVQDLVPLPVHDSKGISGFLAVAGTTVGSLIFSAALFLLASRTSTRKRFMMICAFAPLAGLTAAFATAVVADGLGGPYLAVAGILALVSAATAFTTAGIIRLVGAPGIGLCVVGLAFMSLPSSGGPIGYQFLPAGYQHFTQGLPSTAGISALRGAVYFGGAHTWHPILVLLCWIAAGVTIYFSAAAVRRAHPHPPIIGLPHHLRAALGLADLGDGADPGVS